MISALKPYQLNQGVAIRKAQAGPARRVCRYKLMAVGMAVQQHKGVTNPITDPTRLARTTPPLTNRCRA